jgi:plastocyanin
MKQTRSLIKCLSLGILVFLANGARATSFTVQVVGFSFSPRTITINAGDTITWVTPPSGGHDVEADDGTFKSPPPGTFSTFSFTFSQAKTITYRCNPHAVSFNMRGTIIVQPAQNQAPTVNLTSPGNGATFNSGDSITISANASDPDGSIAKVEFFDGGNLIGSVPSAQGSISVTLAAGQHTLSAKATDNSGATASSGTVTITVNSPANQPPTVEITSPPPGAVFNSGDTITISAHANDPDGSVTKVEFFENGNLIGTATSSPFSVSTTLPPGPHTLTAKATDNAGAITTSAAFVITVNEPGNQSPTITLSAPSNGASFNTGDLITISADASDPDGTIAKVEFFDAGNLIGTDTSAPFSISLALPIGEHTITARATDDRGFGATTEPIKIAVNQPGSQSPLVSITSPANGATFNAGDTISISAEASEPEGTIVRVEFLADGSSIGTSEAPPFAISTTLPPGEHTLTAIATDDSGASATSVPVTILVNAIANNNPPTVSIAYPDDNSAYQFPATITMEATAQDSDGTIVKVEFFDGLGSIGVVTNAPYAMTFNLAATRHVITAVATDNLGATATSPIVHLNVAMRPTLTITRISPTEFKLTAQGTPAVPYTIEGSHDLSRWAQIATITPQRGGNINFTDSVPSDQAFKAYRIVIK